MLSGTEAKIAALGLRVARGCTYHGLAVNIAMDLAPFNDIDPCGYRGLAVTQLSDLGVTMSVERAGADLAPILAARSAQGMTMDERQEARRTRRASSTRAARRPRAYLPNTRSRSSLPSGSKSPIGSACARPSSPRFNEIKRILARSQLAHRVRGSVVPEHRRMLQQGHGDVHDHGRHLHAALPVL
jgi:hypothetical protein